MPWTVHSEKPLYEDEWLDIRSPTSNCQTAATWITD